MAVAAAVADTGARLRRVILPHCNIVVRQIKAIMKYIILLSLAFFLAACSPLSVENYNKLKVGMSYDEVKQILGPPAKCSDVLGVKHCSWGDAQRHVDVNFVGDQVLIFSAENIH